MKNLTIAEKAYLCEKNRTKNIHKPKEINMVRIRNSYHEILKYKDGSLAFKKDPADFYRNEKHFNFVYFGQDF